MRTGKEKTLEVERQKWRFNVLGICVYNNTSPRASQQKRRRRLKRLDQLPSRPVTRGARQLDPGGHRSESQGPDALPHDLFRFTSGHSDPLPVPTNGQDSPALEAMT
ncbi:hypothetical protein Pcinc_032742 [Petrolisthes cinctipes]|uniref:Uncharacterized protein n=1 Tax=Petrolisthes cinctipes TaxID=88211 RepID=A0AAE1ETT7_PETCI|nr:hypothetical protein Pcinc_032742 [Petrolisthes cinctipes]